MAEPMQVESKEVTEEVTEEVRCPVELKGGTCTDPKCKDKWHLCPGRDCGCYGRKWHHPDQFVYKPDRRCKLCENGRELKKQDNARHNARNNARNNAVWNPINNAKTKEKRHREAEARRAEAGTEIDEEVINEECAKAEAEKIAAEERDELGNKSIAEVHKAQNTALYFGYTGQEDHRSEHVEFLRMRGRGKRAPILTWPSDGGAIITITKSQAEHILGFKSIVLYQSKWKHNARLVESALQKHFSQLQRKPGSGKPGVQLWISNDAGAKHDYPEDAGKTHKVFLTFSRKALAAIDAGKIKFNARK